MELEYFIVFLLIFGTMLIMGILYIIKIEIPESPIGALMQIEEIRRNPQKYMEDPVDINGKPIGPRRNKERR